MQTVHSLLAEAADAIQQNDRQVALRAVRVAAGRLEGSVVNRTARLMYETMDQWATFEKGHIRVEALVELLAQEGVLRDGEE